MNTKSPQIDKPTRSGPDTLRLIVRNMNDTNENFNDRYTAAQLVKIYAAHLACGWDFPPDRWTDRQVVEALRGGIPQWDNDEMPLASKFPNRG